MKKSKVNPVRLCLLLILSAWIAAFGLGFIFMKEIKLTQGKVALVDDEDFEWLNQWKWFAAKTSKTSHTFYAVRTTRNTSGPTRIYMHRQLLNITEKKILCDHKDSNGLNNQKSNLRKCNQNQNRANQIKGIRRSSNYKGVCKVYGNSWIASIYSKGKSYHLGTFTDEIEAAKAYNSKAVELFGEFAKLNQFQ